MRRAGSGTRIGSAAFAVALLLALPALAPAASTATGGTGDGEVRLKKLGEFVEPVYVAKAPGFKRLLFVVEKRGVIQVLKRGKRLGRPFLDIHEDVAEVPEGGLLSIAFPRDYRQSRRLYTFHTDADGDTNVFEYRRSRRKPTKALPGSGKRVIEIPASGAKGHLGGQLQFGLGRQLYIGIGDGGLLGDGQVGDPLDNARDLTSLHGKLLRIIPETGGGYRVPDGNPYVGGEGRDEIYSYGLRQPFRFSFTRKSKRIAIADVGPGVEEEVNYERRQDAKGMNFGWPEFEGTRPFDLERPGPDPAEPPIHRYAHLPGTGRCAVIGGYVVRDKALTSLHKRYVYADLCTGELRSFIPKLNGAEDDQALGQAVISPTGFGEGRGGRIYVTSLAGPVYRLRAR
ncbi:MAG: PQQ-dependent sugar dehydrogenase [Solirubrobacterales bacterium]